MNRLFLVVLCLLYSQFIAAMNPYTNSCYLPSLFKLGLIYEEGKHDTPIDYVTAENYFMKAADRGHALSQLHLGFIYEKGGYGLKRNVRQAILYYSLAGHQGIQEARDRLCNLFKEIVGMPWVD